jgi:hypothetical protein
MIGSLLENQRGETTEKRLLATTRRKQVTTNPLKLEPMTEDNSPKRMRIEGAAPMMAVPDVDIEEAMQTAQAVTESLMEEARRKAHEEGIPEGTQEFSQAVEAGYLRLRGDFEKEERGRREREKEVKRAAEAKEKENKKRKEAEKKKREKEKEKFKQEVKGKARKGEAGEREAREGEER